MTVSLPFFLPLTCWTFVQALDIAESYTAAEPAKAPLQPEDNSGVYQPVQTCCHYNHLKLLCQCTFRISLVNSAFFAHTECKA